MVELFGLEPKPLSRAELEPAAAANYAIVPYTYDIVARVSGLDRVDQRRFVKGSFAPALKENHLRSHKLQSARQELVGPSGIEPLTKVL